MLLGVDQELIAVHILLSAVENLEQGELMQVSADMGTGVIQGGNHHLGGENIVAEGFIHLRDEPLLAFAQGKRACLQMPKNCVALWGRLFHQSKLGGQLHVAEPFGRFSNGGVVVHRDLTPGHAFQQQSADALVLG